VAEDADIIAYSLENPAAFEEIFDRHWAAVLRYARQRTGSDMGEEIAARTFLVAFEQRGKFGQKHLSAKPWLFGIATNLIHRQRRQERSHLRALQRMPKPSLESPADSSAKLDAQAQRLLLVGALDRLDQRDRDTFLLSALADLSYPEIALALDVPVGTVRSRISRARARRRELIGPEVGIDDVIGE